MRPSFLTGSISNPQLPGLPGRPKGCPPPSLPHNGHLQQHSPGEPQGFRQDPSRSALRLSLPTAPGGRSPHKQVRQGHLSVHSITLPGPWPSAMLRAQNLSGPGGHWPFQAHSPHVPSAPTAGPQAWPSRPLTNTSVISEDVGAFHVAGNSRMSSENLILTTLDRDLLCSVNRGLRTSFPLFFWDHQGQQWTQWATALVGRGLPQTPSIPPPSWPVCPHRSCLWLFPVTQITVPDAFPVGFLSIPSFVPTNCALSVRQHPGL